MADDTQAPPYNPAAGDLHPALGQFGAPPEFQGWAAGAIHAIQNHIATHAIAQQNIDAGHKFVNDLDQTKKNLVGMAVKDPTAVPLAFNLIDNFPGEHMDAMRGHFKAEVAKGAITGLAGINQAAAHQAIDDYGEHLTDADTAALRTYTDHMEMLRRHDNLSQALDLNRRQEVRSNRTAQSYLGSMLDPATGEMSFPPGFGQQVMQDSTLSPTAKASLFSAYRNLQQNGDPETSNPDTVASLIARTALGHQNPNHPQPPEILAHAGTNLSVADARFLSGITGPQPAGQKQYVQAMSQALDGAREQIGNRQAFSRFVPWFLNAAKSGAVLDPGSKDYLLTPERMSQFRPTGDDVIAPAVNAGPRRPLGEIFGGSRRETPLPANPTETPLQARPQGTPLPAGPQGTPLPANPTETPLPANVRETPL